MLCLQPQDSGGSRQEDCEFEAGLGCCEIILPYAVNMYSSHWLIIKLFGLQQGRIRLGGKAKLRTQMNGRVRRDNSELPKKQDAGGQAKP